MLENKSKVYTFFPGSRLVWLPDGSGIAIYNSYSGDTTFLTNKMPDQTLADLPKFSSGITLTDLIQYLNLGEASAINVIKRLVSEKVLWAK